MNVGWYLAGCATPLLLAVLAAIVLDIRDDWRNHHWIMECPACKTGRRIPHLIPHRTARWLVKGRRGFGHREFCDEWLARIEAES